MKNIILILLLILIQVEVGYTTEIKVFNFTENELSELQVRKVRGAENKTIYIVGSNENGNFLKATADNAASGLGKEIKINFLRSLLFNFSLS